MEMPVGISLHGVAFIARHEGFSAKPYNDAGGNATIGYGRLLHTGKVTIADRIRWRKGLSQSDAMGSLRMDILNAERCVRSNVKRGLAQHEYDALVSFVYNVGCGAFRSSTLLDRLNHGVTDAGILRGQFARWTHAGGVVLPGLVTRREDEWRLFHAADYGA